MSVAPPPRVAVLYLAGLGRSGSTVLERTLGRLPGTVAVGEMVHLWERGVLLDEPCGCGEPFSGCPFWTQVGQLAFGGWDQVDTPRMVATSARVDRTRRLPQLATGRGGARFRADVEEVVPTLAALYGAVSTASGGAVVLDSSKDPSYGYLLRLVPGVALRVVHAIRDAPAVAHSWTKVVERPESAGSVMATWSPLRTSGLWMAQNLAADALRLLGTSVVRVRYEDFVADPLAAVTAVAERAGLVVPSDLMRELAARQVDLRSDHTVSGNPMRFRTGPTGIRRDDGWRVAMDPRDRRRVVLLTAPVRARFGYF